MRNVKLVGRIGEYQDGAHIYYSVIASCQYVRILKMA